MAADEAKLDYQRTGKGHWKMKSMKKRLLIVFVILSLAIAGCQDKNDDVDVGEPQRVSQVPYVMQPHIAVDPLDPDHLAAIVVSVSDFDCDLTCKWELLVNTSTDGGISWTEQSPFAPLDVGDPVVGFDPDGALYAVGSGLRGSLFINRANAEGEMMLENIVSISPLQANDKPWLTIDQRNGDIFVPHGGPTSVKDDRYEYEGIVLERSTDGGVTWSDPVVVEQGVDVSAWQARQEIPPFGAQAMLGEGDHLAVAWIWSSGVDSFPVGVYVAASNDGGQTFSAPIQIAETWGIISTAYHDGRYYVFYRRGSENDQELVASISDDNGKTWAPSLVSGEIPLFFDFEKAPGVNVAPDGTLDVVFYAHGEGAPGCIDIASYRKKREAGYVDVCVYDVYYTFSNDGGQTFRPPVKLNATPIIGSHFVLSQGASRAGDNIGMASTNEYAYPIWIDTQGEEGTQAYTVQIKR